MRPIISATPKERKEIRKALWKQKKETGEFDHRELRKRILKDKGHPARPFFPLDSVTCIRIAQEHACQNILRAFQIKYIDKDTGEEIIAPELIGVPQDGNFFPVGDPRQVRYEFVTEYLKDDAKVQRVFLEARKEFLELCKRYNHNPLARSMCAQIRAIITGQKGGACKKTSRRRA